MSNDQIIPDSANWLFHNNTNIFTSNPSNIYYTSHKKIIVLDQKSGKCIQTLPYAPSSSPLQLSCSQSHLSTYSSDSKVRVHDINTFKELHSFSFPSLKGLKYRGNDLICASDLSCQILNQNFQIINQFDLTSFECIESSQNIFAISTLNETILFRYLDQISIPFNFCTISILESNEGVLLAGVSLNCIRLFREQEEIIEIPIKKINSKLKTPVFSVTWLDKNRIVYSTVTGDLVLVQVSPLKSQSFMNNPHFKAIQGLLWTNLGLFSIGMDRFVCCWDISEIHLDNESKCPRSYSTALAYTEPVWELVTLEASVHSMVIFNDSLVVSCRKSCIFLYQLNTSNIHSRLCSKLTNIAILSMKLCKTSNVFAISTVDSVLFIDLELEKVLNKVKISVSGLEWLNEKEILAFNQGKIFKIDLTGEIKEISTIKYNISALLIKSEQVIYIGTVEGNIFEYNLEGFSRSAYWITHNKQITSFDFGPALVASSEDGTASVYWENVVLLERHYKGILAVVWVDSLVVTGSLDHTCQVWDPVTGAPLANFRGHSGAVRVLIPHPSLQDTIITGSDDQTIRVFSLKGVNQGCSPPKGGSRGDLIVKTLFPEMHKFFYQQTKEEAYDEILMWVKGEIRGKMCFNSISKDQLVQEFNIPEVQLWKQFQELTYKPSEILEIPKRLRPFSLFLGDPHSSSYAECKSEKSLLKRKIHQGVLYLLLSKQPEKALSIYLSLNLHIESIILCKIFDLGCKVVYKAWIKRFLAIKKKEQAAKCFIAMEKYGKALELLEEQDGEKVCEIRNILKARLYMCVLELYGNRIVLRELETDDNLFLFSPKQNIFKDAGVNAFGLECFGILYS